MPSAGTVAIYENGEYKGNFNLEDSQVTDCEVPTGKVELQLIINSTTPKYFKNNNYTIENNIKQVYHADITTINDTITKIKINVTIKNETNDIIPNQQVNLTLPNGSIIEDTTDENGTITFTPELPLGSQDLIISIDETDDNEELITQYNINVKAFNTTTTINIINSTVTDTTINVTVTDGEGNPANNGIIIVTDEEGNYVGIGYIKIIIQ